jgi:DNA-binding CsgD family transcriptional regulator
MEAAMPDQSGHSHSASPRTPCCCESAHFTRREVEIILLLAAGSDTDTVATSLQMSPHTATHHLGNMLKKSGSSNRTELIARAYSAGVLLTGLWPPGWSGRYCLPAPAPAY